MAYIEVFRVLSRFLMALGIPLLFPLGISFYTDFIRPEHYPQGSSFYAFLTTIVLSFLLGYLLFLYTKKRSNGVLFRKEAFLLVVMTYFSITCIGGLPFFLSHTFQNPFDAVFEAASGITTTGATVIEPKKYDAEGKEIQIENFFDVGRDVTYHYFGTIAPVKTPSGTILTGVEAISPALVFWRSMIQWLGGCGIIVLFVAILPALGVGGKLLYQAEVTGPSKEGITPRIKETASMLWKVYLFLTFLQIFFLKITNEQISVFDAITITFSTLSTGGFAPKNGSIGVYQNYMTYWIVIVFMLLGSISFSLYFFLLKRKFSRLNDPELKVFLAIVALAAIFGTYALFRTKHFAIVDEPVETHYTFFQSFTHSAFQLISAQTSTGFSTANYDLWPFSIQTLMLILMFIGGMAGSTAGGIKIIRQQIFFKVMLSKVESIFLPESVQTNRIGQTEIEPSLAQTVLSYFMIVIALTLLGTFIFIVQGIDPETSFATMSSLINNVGFGFRQTGPSGSYAFLSNFSKLLSSIWMIAGRLEFFVILMLCFPDFWRKK